MKFHPLRVLEVRPETADAYTIRFENPDPTLFTYLPGQYLTLRTTVNGEELRRSFSLSSSPQTDAHLSVTIKAIPGGRVSNHLKTTLKAGDTLESYPPQGSFTVTPDANNARHYVLIGGGSGITPLMSMLKTLLETEPKSQVSLLYCNRTPEDIIFKEELSALAQNHTALNVVHTLSKPRADWTGPKGRFEGTHAKVLLQEVLAKTALPADFYLCGPNGLMEAASVVLKNELDVPEERIHREFYTTPTSDKQRSTPATELNPDVLQQIELKEQTVLVHLDGGEHTLTVSPQQYILDAALDAGLDPPYACQEGVCCTCRAKLLSGQVSLDEREGLSDEELEAGFILTCQAHPLTADVELEYM